LNQGVPEKINKTLPDVKLIYIIRDPINRILSDYVHDFISGIETRSLNEIFNNTGNNPYINRSKYFMQLNQYFTYFPFSRIHLLTQEELSYNRNATLKKIFQFLKVDDQFESKSFTRELHLSSNKRQKTKFGRNISQTIFFSKLDRLPINIRYKIQDLLIYPFTKMYSPPTIAEKVYQTIFEQLKDDLDSLRSLTGRKFVNWSI